MIETLCRKYCRFTVRHLLEPACGTGRLVTALAARGYRVTAFDLSQPSLNYLRRQLARRGLCAQTFAADMSDFCLGRSVDAAYCLINTFRLLLTKHAAHDLWSVLSKVFVPAGSMCSVWSLLWNLRGEVWKRVKNLSNRGYSGSGFPIRKAGNQEIHGRICHRRLATGDRFRESEFQRALSPP